MPQLWPRSALANWSLTSYVAGMVTLIGFLLLITAARRIDALAGGFCLGAGCMAQIGVQRYITREVGP